MNPNSNLETFHYDDKIVRAFFWATAIWGLVGMLVGLIVAIQMFEPALNFGLPWTTFGRLRPLHTNAVIFAFAGNAIFMSIYYSTQRLLKARMFSDGLSWAHFWGWQGIIVAAALTLVSGISQSKEYAELEWPIDIAITVVWVIFAVNFFMTIVKRRERHIYVALWFYIATIIAIAMLHIVNNIAIPVGLFKSYVVYSGVQDALVQWWYGHNAVGFFLTTPFLGLMYYFLPKAAEKPVFSYRLSIIHFWSLIFIYIWAGPHHLYYSSLPDWVQSLGMVFSIMLWAPSWGGMLNGLYTLRGAWHKVREEPVLKFFVLAVTAYGMSTFEGPLLSIKSVNKISHFTDWTIAHVHVGALGWVGFMTFGVMYYLIPKLWRKPLYSKSLANAHFWLGFTGIVIYALSMWTAGITQPLMWFATKADGTLLYPDFMETVLAIKPAYLVRALGGVLYLSGVIVFFVNFLKSIAGATDLADTKAEAAALKPVSIESELGALSTPKPGASFLNRLHETIEGWPMVFSVLVVLSVIVGGMVQIIPMVMTQFKAPDGHIMQPYTPLELTGRDIYLREGCYNCHSQMVRPILEEVKRYGPVSKAHEFVYDHPFQWGSKRTGPDLARVGGKYPDLWHYRHLQNPRSTTPSSLMPKYPWLFKDSLDLSQIQTKLRVMKKLGVPYSDAEIENAKSLAEAEAKAVAARLKEQGEIEGAESKEIVALIAYLQRLGRDAVKDEVSLK